MSNPNLEKIVKQNQPKEDPPISRIGDFYFRPRSFEREGDGALYRWLGVHYFKKIVPTFGSFVNRLLNFHPIASAETIEEKEKALRSWEPWTRVYETIHLFLGIRDIDLLHSAIERGQYKEATYVAVRNIVINLYPIMLQRYNRARIYNALENIAEERVNQDE